MGTEEGPKMMLKLTIEKGPSAGQTLEFQPGSEIKIGRLVRGNTLCIKDAGISSKHLCLHFDSGNWVLTDLASSNGTTLNSTALEPSVPARISGGDVIKIGECTSIRVDIESAADGEDGSKLRRNPRRGATGVDGENGGAKIGGNGRRAGRPPRKGRTVESEIRDAEKNNQDDPIANEVDLGRKVLARRTRSAKKEDGSIDQCVSLAASKQMEKISPRRSTRGRKQPDLSEHVVGNILQTELVGGRKYSGRKGNVQKQKVVSVGVSAVEEEGEGSDLKHEDRKEAKEDELGVEFQRMLVDDDRSNLEKHSFNNSASALGIDDEVITRDNVDLEKITLGDWLDYLEVYLPMQIIEATEGMILEMRKTSSKVNDYILQQQKNVNNNAEIP